MDFTQVQVYMHNIFTFNCLLRLYVYLQKEIAFTMACTNENEKYLFGFNLYHAERQGKVLNSIGKYQTLIKNRNKDWFRLKSHKSMCEKCIPVPLYVVRALPFAREYPPI